MSDCPYLARAVALAPGFAERATTWDQDRRYCHENVRDLAASGLMGMTIPKEFG
ncbi:MAG: acyl-CoA dehydrogenase family protein, partial [Pseudomonadota bacterium]